MVNTRTSNNHFEYVGNELELFKNAVNWKNYFSKKLIPYIKGDVLEVGAGIGVNTQFLATNSNVIDSWCFLEPDKQLASEIEGNISNVEILKKVIVNGTIDDIEEQKFDTIIYIDVLEHINDSHNELRKAKHHLKDNGYLIVLVPAYNFLYNKFDKKIGHYRRYDKKMLRAEVGGLLKHEKLFYLDSIGFFASLANKLFLKKELPSLKNVKFWDNSLICLSRFFDVVFLKTFGKSLIGIFRNEI